MVVFEKRWGKMSTNKNIISFCMRVLCAFFLCMFIFTPSNSEARILSSIVIDAHSGEVIESRNADKLVYPASLTKIMTLYITFDALDKGLIKPDDKLKVSRTAANRSPSKLGLRAGDTITVQDAILALIIKSANDCATVLAEGLGYTEENFAKAMTKVAHALGMKNTTFKNASGLPNRAQKTTARDMALLGAAIYHHFPKYYHLFSSANFTFDDRTYKTHNKILKSFEGADGLKTGFTNAAGYNIVTSAERNGHRVIAVVMGYNTAKQRDKKVSALMDKGLLKLSMKAKVQDSNIHASLEEKSPAKTDAKEVASLENYDEEEEEEEVYAIQVGAFSNYARAKKHAGEIHQEIQKRFTETEISIEAINKGAAVVYRSKITGFTKNDAEKVCNRLKEANKSCIITAVEHTNTKLVTAHNDKQKIAHNSNQ